MLFFMQVCTNLLHVITHFAQYIPPWFSLKLLNVLPSVYPCIYLRLLVSSFITGHLHLQSLAVNSPTFTSIFIRHWPSHTQPHLSVVPSPVTVYRYRSSRMSHHNQFVIGHRIPNHICPSSLQPLPSTATDHLVCHITTNSSLAIAYPTTLIRRPFTRYRLPLPFISYVTSQPIRHWPSHTQPHSSVVPSAVTVYRYRSSRMSHHNQFVIGHRIPNHIRPSSLHPLPSTATVHLVCHITTNSSLAIAYPTTLIRRPFSRYRLPLPIISYVTSQPIRHWPSHTQPHSSVVPSPVTVYRYRSSRMSHHNQFVIGHRIPNHICPSSLQPLPSTATVHLVCHITTNLALSLNSVTSANTFMSIRPIIHL